MTRRSLERAIPCPACVRQDLREAAARVAARSRPRLWGIVVGGLLLGWFLPTAVCGQPVQEGAPQQKGPMVFGLDPDDTTPTVERPPFDRITLKESGDGAILYCQPIGLTGPVDPAAQNGLLKFELLDRPNQYYTVAWRDIARVELFAEIVVAETRQAFESGDYNTAFRNLIYLHDNRGASDPIVEQLLEPFWYADAKALFDGGNHELALTGFEELYRRNPNFIARGEQFRPVDYIASAYDRILQAFVQQGDFDSVVAKLQDVREKYPRPPAPIAGILQQWESVLEQKKREVADALAAQTADPNLVVAHQSVRALAHAVPNDPRTAEALQRVFDAQPAIIVGTEQVAVEPQATSLDSWAARRLGHLLTRQLVELIGLGDDGGLYQYAEGNVVAVDEFGRAYRFEIDPARQDFADKTTVLDLAQRLASLIDENSTDFYFPLAKIVQSIEILDSHRVQVRLHRPYARFESLFRVPLHSEPHRAAGAYQLEPDIDGSPYGARVYRANPQHEREEALSPPPLVIERQFSTGSAAARALLRGEIDVWDRVSPAELDKLRADPEIAVRPYLIPSVHLLIPNPRNGFMQDQTFRRGLLYAIDRDTIVRQLICGGRELPGYTSLSGPFPLGSEENDLIGYAYDIRVPPTEFDSRMAIIAPSVVLAQIRKAAKARFQEERAAELRDLNEDEIFKKLEEWADQDKSLAVPTLILTFPDTDLARTACQTMQQMWKSVGITVELKPLPPGATRPADDDYDLWYVDLTMEEPLSDARKVLGDLGLVHEIGPSIEQLLGELDLAKNWVEARNTLRQIHELCQYDMVVLPLWQTINYYAYRRNVFGIESGLVHLYDGVDRWRIDPDGVRRTADDQHNKVDAIATVDSR